MHKPKSKDGVVGILRELFASPVIGPDGDIGDEVLEITDDSTTDSGTFDHSSANIAESIDQ